MKPNKQKLETFFAYIVERELTRLRKASRRPQPWSEWPVLNQYRFTNVKRDYDRTTIGMRRIYNQHQQAPAEEVVFNCGLYRYFGTAEFAEAVGWFTRFGNDEQQWLVEVANQRKAANVPVFTGAYVITNGGIPGSKQSVVTSAYMAPLWRARKAVAGTARSTRSLQHTAAEFAKVPGFRGSGFMAKEAMLDMMFFPWFSNPKDRADWSLCGPGARKGLNIIWDRDPNASMGHKQALEEMRYLHACVEDYLPRWLAPRFKDLHDIQWNLCEVAKYFTIAEGGKGKRTYVPREVLEERANREKKTDGSTTLTSALMIEIYNAKVNTGKTNKELAEFFNLKNDSMVHRAIHRAINRGLVDGEAYRKMKAPGRQYGKEGVRNYTHSEQRKRSKK